MNNTPLNPKTLLIPIFLSIICCNTENGKVEKEKKNLDFNINYELLNPEAITDDEGFMMNVPANWNPLDSLLKSKLTRSFSLLGEPTKLILVNAFRSQGGSQCIVSKVITDKKDFSFISEDIISSIQSKIHGDGYKTNTFNINNLSAKQYLVRGKNHVVIKLYIRVKEFYQVDFIIPRTQYETELESIESSIGTITYKGKL